MSAGPSTAAGLASVVLAGGGTTGHTAPLIATAGELERLRPGVRLTAVGTARGLETRVVPAAGLTLELIPPVPMPRRPGVDQALVGLRLEVLSTEAYTVVVLVSVVTSLMAPPTLRYAARRIAVTDEEREREKAFGGVQVLSRVEPR